MEFIERITSTVHVLGLGESLEDYVSDGNTTIGVNDIHSEIKTDFVVCVDHPTAFNDERRKSILQTKCKGFYSHIEEWKTIPNFKMIEFAPGRGNFAYFDDDKIIPSNSSPFVAVMLAFKWGAKNIILHGCDYRTHPNFRDIQLETIRLHFRTLQKELNKRGVNLFVGSDWSMLSEFLPVWE